MKAHLLHRDRDFDLEADLPENAADLVQDLGLESLFVAMARGDKYLLEVARRSVLQPLVDPQEIEYRQRVLADCLQHPDAARELYDIAVAAIEGERKIYLGWFSDSPDIILHRSVQVLELFLGILRTLRRFADLHAAEFRSDGFVRFVAMVEEELDDEYLDAVQHNLDALHFSRGVLLSAGLGEANKGTRYVLHLPRELRLLERFLPGRRPGLSFTIAERDDAGHRALSELRGRGINLVANALAQSTDHILSFFQLLRAELGFYIGCLNLHEQLAARGEPICFPAAVAPGEPIFTARGLFDVALALNTSGPVVGNDVDADSRQLVMVTGVNTGGKSTFLRSVGLAQLMLQAGMFVGATSFRADIRDGIFTHYKREEDATMESGKLDEELGRMSVIANQIRRGSLLLCNESFGSTNEREGSEIARQIVRALTEGGVKVYFVTHLFDLADSLHRADRRDALFLRAEWLPDGGRTFRMVEGEPQPTSHGEDLYRRVFETGRNAAESVA